ncbi:MAG: NADH-quinone oxidoreductase subunit L [Acidobacteriaceae bacterium]
MNPQLLWLIPIFPFVGFLINGLLGRMFPRALVSAVALTATLLPALLVTKLWMVMTAAGGPLSVSIRSVPWIAVSGFHVDFAFTVDHLTLVMLGVVTGVGFLIHVYSVGYMAHEDGFGRFFAYLNLFMFFMLVLVLSSSFLLLFVGWEGVGLSSYLLIGFYFLKDSAANAGKKAFIVNRIGDFGFLLAMFLLVARYGTLDFHTIFARIAASPVSGGFFTTIALLLVLGATGKSAQIPLYIWLPDAMEGPTPVSALIHAATMVTAGVYMVARCHVLFNHSPVALTVVAGIGAITALFAATMGMVQHDIKRVLAYSTISQLGYMFLACGVGAYSAGIFHLMTHAFFKGLLFLAAGSVIHALSGEQDMRYMGGLWKKIPITFWTMTAATFAISGVWPFSGFFSKDEILFQTFQSTNPLAKLLWFVGLVTAGMTSFYMFRLWFKTFFGESRFAQSSFAHASHGDSHDAHHAQGIHESPLVMTVPLMLLGVLSLVGGWVGVPAALGGHNAFGHFLDPVFANAAAPAATQAAETASHGSELGLAALSLATAGLGIVVAWFFYYRKPGTAAELARRFQPIYSLVYHKYWIDEIYGWFVVTPLLGISRLLLGGLVDGGIVQGTGSALAASAHGGSWLVRRMQSGKIRSYAGWLAAGAAVVIVLALFIR